MLTELILVVTGGTPIYASTSIDMNAALLGLGLDWRVERAKVHHLQFPKWDCAVVNEESSSESDGTQQCEPPEIREKISSASESAEQQHKFSSRHHRVRTNGKNATIWRTPSRLNEPRKCCFLLAWEDRPCDMCCPKRIHRSFHECAVGDQLHWLAFVAIGFESCFIRASLSLLLRFSAIIGIIYLLHISQPR